jgi:hypothetical protein
MRFAQPRYKARGYKSVEQRLSAAGRPRRKSRPSAPKFRMKVPVQRKLPVLCTSGPFMGHTLYLTDGATTGVIEVGGQRGRYVGSEWREEA